MQVSIREVLQLAERCFAAADFSKGTARSRAEAIWWTEAYHGSGFSTLHSMLDGLPAYDHSALRMRVSGSLFSVVDGADQPSIVSMDATVDLSCSHAERHGVGLGYATICADDETLATIGHAAFRVAQRGLIPLVLYTDGGERSGAYIGSPDRPYPILAEVALESPAVTFVDIVDAIESGLYQQHHTPLAQAVFDTVDDSELSFADERLLKRLLQGATEPSPTAGSEADPGVVVLCLDPTHARFTDGLQGIPERFVDDHETSLETVFRPGRIEGRVETLMNDGVEVDRQRWEDVFEFNTGVLAPPFEGSEKGAGFGLND
ncbi:hypothetical protein [Haloarchaeobius sp. TZWSO28]|uniref:hypothetical protein n=1 Tax=Haloarchaeobius sp. TZWSO28 TaxID=3446119 RepID=UPI003EBE0F07